MRAGALVLVLLAGGCAALPGLIEQEPARPYVWPGSWRGATQCVPPGGDSRSWLRTTVYERGEAPEVTAHEHVHAAQIKRFPTCEAFDAWYRANVAEAEAEALCANARAISATQPDRWTLETQIRRQAEVLSTYYVPSLTVDQAAAMIRGFCAGVP